MRKKTAVDPSTCNHVVARLKIVSLAKEFDVAMETLALATQHVASGFLDASFQAQLRAGLADATVAVTPTYSLRVTEACPRCGQATDRRAVQGAIQSAVRAYLAAGAPVLHPPHVMAFRLSKHSATKVVPISHNRDAG